MDADGMSGDNQPLFPAPEPWELEPNRQQLNDAMGMLDYTGSAKIVERLLATKFEILPSDFENLGMLNYMAFLMGYEPPIQLMPGRHGITEAFAQLVRKNLDLLGHNHSCQIDHGEAADKP
jgi:hypothetical protein